MQIYVQCSTFEHAKKDEMGRVYSTNGRKGMHVGYWWEIKKERDH
jgi:hypothetical protein